MPHYWDYIHFITDLGDSAILLPISFSVFVLLVIFRDYRLSVAWALSVGLCALTMTLLKVGFRLCGTPWEFDTLVSPSGHVALSIAVYGSLAALLAMRSANPRVRIILPVLAMALAVLVAFTRVTLGAHTVVEVLVGFSVGTIFAALFWWLTSDAASPKAPFLIIALFSMVPLITLHGQRLDAEDTFEFIASKIRGATGVCLAEDGRRSRRSQIELSRDNIDR